MEAAESVSLSSCRKEGIWKEGALGPLTWMPATEAWSRTPSNCSCSCASGPSVTMNVTLHAASRPPDQTTADVSYAPSDKAPVLWPQVIRQCPCSNIAGEICPTSSGENIPICHNSLVVGGDVEQAQARAVPVDLREEESHTVARIGHQPAPEPDPR